MAVSMPHSRRAVRWVVATGIALGMLGICGSGAWLWMPYCAPDWVVRHSPWLEPVVRVRMYYSAAFNGDIDHPMENPDPYLYEERIDSWGPDLARELAPLLHTTSAMREAALETFPLQVPLAERARSFREPKDWERIVLNVKSILDEDRPWYLARVNNKVFELKDGRSRGMEAIGDLFNRARLSSDSMAHPRFPERSIRKVRIELRIDSNVPFWLVDQLIHTINGRSAKPANQEFAYMDVTVSTGRFREEHLLSTTSLPMPSEASIVTLVPHSNSTQDARVDVLVDGQPAITVDGPVNSRDRHDGIVRAIERGLSGAPARCLEIGVRGCPLTPWGDVVAGLDGAQKVNATAGLEENTVGPEGSTARTSLTIAPMITGKPVGDPFADEPPPETPRQQPRP